MQYLQENALRLDSVPSGVGLVPRGLWTISLFTMTLTVAGPGIMIVPNRRRLAKEQEKGVKCGHK